MCNNIRKLIDLMQEIEDFKLALLTSKEFRPLCSMPHVPTLMYSGNCISRDLKGPNFPHVNERFP